MTDQPNLPQRFCFVIGPIGLVGSARREAADLFLGLVARPALEPVFRVKRAEEDVDPGRITTAMIADLDRADVVLADLTEGNANCFYELGIRHTLRKPTVYVSRDDADPPFDLGGHRIIRVNMGNFESIKAAIEQISLAAKLCCAEDYIVDNPVTASEVTRAARDTTDPQGQALATILNRLSSIEDHLQEQPGKMRAAPNRIVPMLGSTMLRVSFEEPVLEAIKTVMNANGLARRRQGLHALKNALEDAHQAGVDVGYPIEAAAIVNEAKKLSNFLP